MQCRNIGLRLASYIAMAINTCYQSYLSALHYSGSVSKETVLITTIGLLSTRLGRCWKKLLSLLQVSGTSEHVNVNQCDAYVRHSLVLKSYYRTTADRKWIAHSRYKNIRLSL